MYRSYCFNRQYLKEWKWVYVKGEYKNPCMWNIFWFLYVEWMYYSNRVNIPVILFYPCFHRLKQVSFAVLFQVWALSIHVPVLLEWGHEGGDRDRPVLLCCVPCLSPVPLHRRSGPAPWGRHRYQPRWDWPRHRVKNMSPQLLLGSPCDSAG